MANYRKKQVTSTTLDIILCKINSLDKLNRVNCRKHRVMVCVRVLPVHLGIGYSKLMKMAGV